MAVYKVSVEVGMMLDIEVLLDKDEELKAERAAEEIAQKQMEAWSRWKREDVVRVYGSVSVKDVGKEVF